jgi:hypothetical protein
VKKQCQPAWGECPGACRYFGADPDGDYCGHPKSFEISPTFGASTNRMSREGLCTHGDKGEYQLWEGREQ